MRKIKNSQRLSYNLIYNIIISSMKTCPIKSGYNSILRSRNIFAIIHTIQRKQLVLLESYICIDIQLHILSLQWSNTNRDFCTAVTHRTNIGEQCIVGKRRNTYPIIIKHIGCLRVVIIDRQQQAVTIKAHIETGIESMFYFPLQIGIDIT